MSDLLTVLDPPSNVPGDTTPAPDTEADSVACEDFDWLTDDSVIIPKQPVTAVYRNRVNAVVIRQEGDGYDERDHFVTLAGPLEVRTLIAALQRELRG